MSRRPSHGNRKPGLRGYAARLAIAATSSFLALASVSGAWAQDCDLEAPNTAKTCQVGAGASSVEVKAPGWNCNVATADVERLIATLGATERSASADRDARGVIANIGGAGAGTTSLETAQGFFLVSAAPTKTARFGPSDTTQTVTWSSCYTDDQLIGLLPVMMTAAEGYLQRTGQPVPSAGTTDQSGSDDGLLELDIPPPTVGPEDFDFD